MAQIVKPHSRQPVLLHEIRERDGQPVGLDPVAHLVHENVAVVGVIVAVAADFLIPCLRRLDLLEVPAGAPHQRQRPQAGFGLGGVLLDDGLLAADHGGGHGALDGDGASLEVDGVPFEPQHLAPPQTVEGR